MSYQGFKEYLRSILSRYQAASKKEKTGLLNHAEIVTKRTRKQITRRLNQEMKPKPSGRKVGRPKKYREEELLEPIAHIWVHMERVDGGRMKQALAD